MRSRLHVPPSRITSASRPGSPIHWRLGRLLPAFGIALGCLIAAPPSWCHGGEPEYSAEERDHWSFARLEPTRPPQIEDQAGRQWIRTPIDAFVWSRLRAAGLRPAPEASRRVLIRRVYFDVTGLPPTPKDVRAFLNDPAPDAYERLVDRLLAETAYAEQWAQHWLDVVRFAETEGFEYDRHRPGAWRFRDYVIRAFNRDQPYDRFVREQIAGDEMEADDPQTRVAQQVAAGLHRSGPIRRNAGNPEVAFSRNEVLTEMTNIVGSAFLGMTVGCARCHDHFFDPIRQADYYRLQAFFGATHEENISLVRPKQQREWNEQTKKIDAQIAALRKKLAKAPIGDKPQRQQLTQEIDALEKTRPAPLPTISGVRNDFKRWKPVRLLIRGDEFRPGPPVGMRVLGVLLPEGTKELPGKTPKPKTRLAEWVTSPDNPLTARVIANRLWNYYFGTGIVATTDDFGANGDEPSHPQLLDYLANEVLRDGWRLKRVQRAILFSSAYRQSSRSPDAAQDARKDPDNRLIWKHPRRRLTAEELRDAMLSVSGQLHRKLHGPSVMVPVEQELVDLLYKPTQWKVAREAGAAQRRSVYLIAKRNLRLPFLEVFDQPDLQCACGNRPSSTHAPQALEMLNGSFSTQVAQALADRLAAESESSADPEKQVQRAFELVAGRPPTARERRLSVRFLERNSLREFALAMLNLNAFLYVE